MPTFKPKDGVLKLKYKSNFAPIVNNKQYEILMKAYEQTGKLPRRLQITGMVIDTSMNANHWSVPKEEMENIAEQMVGQQIRKDHSDSVDSIIGKVDEAWTEEKDDGIQVWAKGEIGDENLIQKILLGYVKFSSIQLLSENVLCNNCLMKNHKTEQEAKITNLEAPCPNCGQYELLVKGSKFVEWSMVSLPAYEKAEIQPLGFKASLDQALEQRFSPKIETHKEEVINTNHDKALFIAVATAGTVALMAGVEAFLSGKKIKPNKPRKIKSPHYGPKAHPYKQHWKRKFKEE